MREVTGTAIWVDGVWLIDVFSLSPVRVCVDTLDEVDEAVAAVLGCPRDGEVRVHLDRYLHADDLPPARRDSARELVCHRRRQVCYRRW
jgi:hypothetical protein